ncbi:MAG: hypothetical protein JHC87_02795 [Thermoleophilaceae bacterium]|nr:hypothetical protein [Thermoleophilaceae bacterium]
MRSAMDIRAEGGAAAVEFLALLPVVAVVVACGLFAVTAAFDGWKLQEAARTAAREAALASQSVAGDRRAGTIAKAFSGTDATAEAKAAAAGGTSVELTAPITSWGVIGRGSSARLQARAGFAP